MIPMSSNPLVSINEPFAEAFEDILNPNIRFVIYKGGRGSGKTEHIARFLVMKFIEKKVRIWCTREVQATLEDSVYHLLTRILAEFRRKYGFSDYKLIPSKKKIINTANGAEFLCSKGLNEIDFESPESMKGIDDIDYVWLEEAQTIKYNSIKILVPTLRKKGSRLFGSMNPKTDEDPIIEFFKNHPKAKIIHVNYYDNPFLILYAPETLEEAEICKQLKPDEYSQEWLGVPKRRNIAYVVPYYSEKTNGNMLDFIPYWSDRPIYITCDFNVDPMSWAIVQQVNGKSMYIDEIVMENAYTEDAIEEFINRYRDHKSTVVINGDASGSNRNTQSRYHNFKIMKNALIRSGFRDIKLDLIRSNPYKPDRAISLNQRVLDSKGVRRLFVAKKCKHIRTNLRTLQYKPGTSIWALPGEHDIKKDPDLKFIGHIFDAVGYHEYFYHPVKLDRTTGKRVRKGNARDELLKSWNGRRSA